MEVVVGAENKLQTGLLTGISTITVITMIIVFTKYQLPVK